MVQQVAAKKQIDRIVASQNNWKGLLLLELRQIILSASPEIIEDVKWKMPSKPLGSPTWEVDGILCVADYLKNAVRLTFPKGASFSDPKGVFNSRLDSKTARAIDFFKDEKVPAAALKAIVKQAIKQNRD